MKTGQKIRTFIAVPLPEDIRAFCRRLQTQLKKQGFHASWPRPENLHLTLKFIGDIDPSRINGLKSCMKSAVSGIQDPIKLSVAGVGVFPSVKHTRVIWAGIQGQTDILGKVAFQLDRSLNQQLHIRAEKKRFAPHLTLARVKSKINPGKMIQIMQEFSSWQSDFFEINAIHLCKSRLEPAGAVHRQLYTHTF